MSRKRSISGNNQGVARDRGTQFCRRRIQKQKKQARFIIFHGKTTDNYGIYNRDGYFCPQYGKEDAAGLFFNLRVLRYPYDPDIFVTTDLNTNYDFRVLCSGIGIVLHPLIIPTIISIWCTMVYEFMYMSIYVLLKCYIQYHQQMYAVIIMQYRHFQTCY